MKRNKKFEVPESISDIRAVREGVELITLQEDQGKGSGSSQMHWKCKASSLHGTTDSQPDSQIDYYCGDQESPII
jgi:hypothetical protein